MSSLEYLAYPVIVANHRQSTTMKKELDIGDYLSHKNKLELARPRVDNKPPRAQTHHHFKMSKIQEDQKKIGRIERENKQLAERLATIQRGTGMVDCWNEYFQRRIHGTISGIPRGISLLLGIARRLHQAWIIQQTLSTS
ncbi:uncharacterized protein CFAP97D1 isoform X2 [Gopherus evgoodei]|uniref:uncharacterized protein CFAP97D1 isoform X2 n=1 Tax=Gopherus evgoodei TaxID=1825980 RepID=UPI0011CF1FE6|nr:uncharacterized protein CFAP97D1 isoform X2 [Gopherus evgoodei]